MSYVYSKEFNGREVVGFMSQATLSRLDWLVREYDVKTVIELGAFVGLSTIWLAERVERVITIDNFDVNAHTNYKRYVQPMHEAAASDQYAEFLRNTINYPNIVGIWMDFFEAARLPIEADMVYIDGVQPYPQHRKLVELWLPKARKVIAGDDTKAPSVKQTCQDLGIEVTERTWWKGVS